MTSRADRAHSRAHIAAWLTTSCTSGARQPCLVAATPPQSWTPQHRSVVARIDEIKHRLFFGEDAVEGEVLTLMRGARPGQPDRYLVDRGFDQLTGRTAVVSLRDQQPIRAGAAVVFRPRRRRTVVFHRGGRTTGASISGRVQCRRCRGSGVLLGAQTVRSNPCTPRSPNARPRAPLGAIPSSSQRATGPRQPLPGVLNVGQADEPGDRLGVADQEPSRGAGFAFGVVLPQPATSPRPITRRLLGSLGGVDVVVDRPSLQLGDRQHRSAYHGDWLWHPLCHNHSRTLVQMCRAVFWEGRGVTYARKNMGWNGFRGMYRGERRRLWMEWAMWMSAETWFEA
jgi:hypothetical protein